jgi:HAD superfamily hydrolase (TIGR01450 family)
MGRPVDGVSAARSLRDCAGFVFDLDGCVWNGQTLNPGAAEALAALDALGRRIGFLTNNSRATGAEIRDRLERLGVTCTDVTLTPLEIIGEAIAERFGPSRALVIGAAELAEAVRRGGHEIIDVPDYRRATVVVVGNDFDLSYERLTAAARAASAGAPLITPNRDPRLPLEGGDFLPGCGAVVEAVAVAAGVRPIVIGKPAPTLFEIALRRLGLAAHEAAMVGDSVPADIVGARTVGMYTVLYAPDGATDSPPADSTDSGGPDVIVRSFAELSSLAGVV